jgi:hypothetical protein
MTTSEIDPVRSHSGSAAAFSQNYNWEKSWKQINVFFYFCPSAALLIIYGRLDVFGRHVASASNDSALKTRSVMLAHRHHSNDGRAV